MEDADWYKTIKGTAEGLYKEKGSKFIARVFNVTTDEEAKKAIIQMKNEYHDARHHCYAYRINPENSFFKSSDDGEPSGTAGKPILNQIYSNELFNVLVVVIRYFGGTKLGVSGLIRAYKTATSDAFANSNIVYETMTRTLHLHFNYPLMNNVMRIVKEENLKVIHQDFALDCRLEIEVVRSKKEKLEQRFTRIYGLTVN